MLAALWAALRYCYPLLLVLLLWELVARAGLVRPLFLPTVTTVLEQFWVLLFEGEIVAPLLVSLYRAFAGLALAVVFGVLAGLWMARSKWAHWALDPLVSLGFPAPKIAFVPIFILWFGIDHLSKILLVAFTCVFPDDRRDLSRGGSGEPHGNLVGGGDGHVRAQAALPDHLSRRAALYLQRRAGDRAGRADHRVHRRDDRRRRRGRRGAHVRPALSSRRRPSSSTSWSCSRPASCSIS